MAFVMVVEVLHTDQINVKVIGPKFKGESSRRKKKEEVKGGSSKAKEEVQRWK